MSDPGAAQKSNTDDRKRSSETTTLSVDQYRSTVSKRSRDDDYDCELAVDYGESTPESEEGDAASPVASPKSGNKTPQSPSGSVEPEEGELQQEMLEDKPEQVYAGTPEEKVISNADDDFEALQGLLAKRKRQWPWLRELRSAQRFKVMVSADHPGRAIFDCTMIRDVARNNRQNVDWNDDVNKNDEYYIVLFLTSSHAWNSFLVNYTGNPKQWRDRLRKARDRYEKHSWRGKCFAVHRMSVEMNVPCGVRPEYHCVTCGSNDPHLPVDDIIDYQTSHRKWGQYISMDSVYAIQMLDRAFHKSKANEFAGTRSTSQAHPVKGCPPAPKYQRLGKSHASGRGTTAPSVCRASDRDDRSDDQQSTGYFPGDHATEAAEEEEFVPILPEDSSAQSWTAPSANDSRIELLESQLTTVQADLDRLRTEHEHFVRDYKKLLGELLAAGVRLPRAKAYRASDTALNTQRNT